MKTLKASFGRTVQRYYFAGSTQESRMRFFIFMNSLEKRFLLDSRFSGNEKLLCFFVWANNFPTKDVHITNATDMCQAEIDTARRALIEKKIIDNANGKFSFKSIKSIYGQ
jgi:hypothetical protein